MAYLFPLKGNLEQNLKCHQKDCGMNVFNFLGIIPRKKALYIADTTDDIYATRITEFLTDTYGVQFRQEQMWNVKDGEKEEIGRKMVKLYNNLYVFIPEKKGVIIFINNTHYGHFAIIGKIDDELYLIDPQVGVKHLLLSEAVDGFFMFEKFENVFVYISEGPETRNKPNINAFHNNLMLNKNFTKLLNSRGTPYFNTKLKHIAKRVIMHHSQLIKGKKYQIIDKITEQPIDIGIFNKKIEGASFIIKHNSVPDEEFYVSTDDNKFIKVKDSFENTDTNVTPIELIKGKKYQIIDKITEQPINIGLFDKIIEGASFIIKHIGKPDEEFGVSMDDNKFIRIKENLGSIPTKGKSRSRSRSNGKTRKAKSI